MTTTRNTIEALPERHMTEHGLEVKARLVSELGEKVFTTVIGGVENESQVTTLMDPWLRLLIFDMMEVGGDWEVRGTVSKSCLRNMERFNDYWHSIDSTCAIVHLHAENVFDDSAEATDNGALLPFSGGLDASYTAYRHTHHLAGHKNLDIKAALMVHGADIPLDKQEQFDAALHHNQEMLADLGVHKVHVIRTDYHTMSTQNFDWGYHTHMAVLIGLASFLSPMYKNVVTGSSSPFPVVPKKWGDNPISDYMLGSRIFEVHTDDFSKSRTEKAELVCNWKVGMEKLRVCWESSLDGTGTHNCGHCEKCIRTNLNFLACGVQLPGMPVLSLKEIAANHGEIHLMRVYTSLLDYAHAHNCTDPWVPIMERKIKKYQARLAWPRLLKRVWNKAVKITALWKFRHASTQKEFRARYNYWHNRSIPL